MRLVILTNEVKKSSMYLHCIYMKVRVFPKVLQFEWDEGNSNKNWIKHNVSIQEQEEVFFNKDKLLLEDNRHSQEEKRLLLYSKTKKGRKLIIAFTIRDKGGQLKIRPISARRMNRKEEKLYEETIKMA